MTIASTPDLATIEDQIRGIIASGITGQGVAAQRRRYAIGQLLVIARPMYPGRGRRAKGWGDFLARVGMEPGVARRYLATASAGPLSLRSGNNATRPRPPWLGFVLGLAPDAWVAHISGLSTHAVGLIRTRAGIPSARGSLFSRDLLRTYRATDLPDY